MATDLTDKQIDEIAARIGGNSLHATRLHEMGGLTRTIFDPKGLVEFARAILAATPAPSSRISGDADLCRSCGYEHWCREHSKCYRSMEPLAAGVPCTFAEHIAAAKERADEYADWFLTNAAGVPCTMPEGEAVALWPATNKQLHDALVEWYQLSDGITVGIPSELLKALVERLGPPDWQGGLSNDELRATFKSKLPNVEPTDRELSVFALGVEVGAKGHRGQDCEGKTGEPFFTVKNIKLATMTLEQEVAAQQGWCMKCAQPSLSEKHQEDGMRWLQCSHCKTVYALGDCEGNGQGDPNGRS